MARFDIDLIRDYIEDDICDNGWDEKIDFEYEQDDETLTVSANVTLNNHDDDVYVEIYAYTGGSCSMRAVFDKLDKNLTTLNLLNDFNDSVNYFKAYVRDDGYLEIKHFFMVLDETSYQDCVGEFLSRLGGLADNEILQRITKLTR